MVAIKTCGGAFLQGPDRQSSDCSHQGCWLRRTCSLLTNMVWEVNGNKVRLCAETFPTSSHTSAVCGTLYQTCNLSLEGGNTGWGVKCCLLMKTLDECLTDSSGKENTASSYSSHTFPKLIGLFGAWQNLLRCMVCSPVEQNDLRTSLHRGEITGAAWGDLKRFTKCLSLKHKFHYVSTLTAERKLLRFAYQRDEDWFVQKNL